MALNTAIAPEGIIIFTSSGIIALTSAHTQLVFKYSKAELSKSPIEKIMPGSNAPLLFHLYKRATHHHAAIPEADKEATGRTKESTLISLEISLNRFKGL